MLLDPRYQGDFRNKLISLAKMSKRCDCDRFETLLLLLHFSSNIFRGEAEKLIAEREDLKEADIFAGTDLSIASAILSVLTEVYKKEVRVKGDA